MTVTFSSDRLARLAAAALSRRQAPNVNCMTHEDYVASVRGRIAATAASMLDGTLPFLEGARALVALRREAEVRDDDPDFLAFVAADSETDALPIGAVRKLWADEALERLEPQIQAATQWATNYASAACASLVRRFGA